LQQQEYNSFEEKPSILFSQQFNFVEKRREMVGGIREEKDEP
jgi:hypothetical protein